MNNARRWSWHPDGLHSRVAPTRVTDELYLAISRVMVAEGISEPEAVRRLLAWALLTYPQPSAA